MSFYFKVMLHEIIQKEFVKVIIIFLLKLSLYRNTLTELTVKESGVKTISEILLCDTAYNPAGRINIGTRAYTGICQGGVKYVELFYRGLGLLHSNESFIFMECKISICIKLEFLTITRIHLHLWG